MACWIWKKTICRLDVAGMRYLALTGDVHPIHCHLRRRLGGIHIALWAGHAVRAVGVVLAMNFLWPVVAVKPENAENALSMVITFRVSTAHVRSFIPGSVY